MSIIGSGAHSARRERGPLIAGVLTVLVLVELRSNAVHALEPRERPRGYGAELFQERHGMPSNSVRALAQARDGQIWVATVGGVAHYDGTKFIEAALPLDAAPTAQVTRLLATQDGSVWIAPQFRLPIRAVGNGFDDVRAYAGLPWEGRVSAWAERPDGTVVVATKESLWAVAGRRATAMAIPGIDAADVTTLAFTANGDIWMGTKHGVRLASAAGTRAVAGEAGTQPTEALVIDRHGVVFTVAHHQLYRMNTSGESTPIGEALPGATICLADDRDGNLWLGGGWGLGRLRDGLLQLAPPIDSLSAPDVTALLEDREGNLWVGTRDAGLMRLTDRTLEAAPLPAAYRSAALEALCEDDEGALWIVPEAAGIARFDGLAVKTFTRADGLPSSTVRTCVGAADGGVWIGTDGGLARWHAGVLEQETVWVGRVTALSRGRHGALWIGGVSRIGRLVEGTLTVFEGDGVQMDDIRVVTEDAAGVVWIATGSRGLFQLRDGNLAPVAIPEASLQVRSIHAAEDGEVLLATSGKGLLRVSGAKRAALGVGDGLPTDVLYQMLEDDDGHLWIGTHRGLMRIPRASFAQSGAGGAIEVALFDHTDFDGGIVAARRRQGSALKRRDGSLWFVVERGAVRVDPRHTRINKVVPAVMIQGLTVNGKERAATEGSVLAPNVARLELRFAALSFEAPQRNRYRFLLEGLDREWTYAGTRPNAVYTHLRPGSYRFRVQGSNDDGVWNAVGATLGFIVQPTYYQAGWFAWVCALAVLGLMVLAYRLRLRVVRTRYLLVIAERARMARDLHDTLLQELFAVAMQLEAARRLVPANALSLASALDAAQRMVARGLQETRTAVWDLRSSTTARDELALSIERLGWRLDQTLDGRGRVHVHTERARRGAATRLPSHTSTELFRIAQEAITNALRHGDPRRVDVTLEYASDHVRLTVRDDGIGFEIETTVDAAIDHFGIRGMRERAAALGGALVMHSQVRQGTTVELTLPFEPAAAMKEEPRG